MVVEEENGYAGLNPPKVYWNKLFHHVKNYVSTQFKLFNYIYHFNYIKNIYLTKLYFSVNIF